MAKKQTWKVKVYTWMSSLLDKNNPTRYYKPATMPGHALEIVSEEDSNEPPVLS